MIFPRGCHRRDDSFHFINQLINISIFERKLGNGLPTGLDRVGNGILWVLREPLLRGNPINNLKVQQVRVCLSCGDLFEGDGCVCGTCKVELVEKERLKNGKQKGTFSLSGFLDSLGDWIMILMSILAM